jgi:hypothetical protein
MGISAVGDWKPLAIAGVVISKQLWWNHRIAGANASG